jgi:hypothetical protein
VKQSTKPHLGESERIFISEAGEAFAKRMRIATKGGNDKLGYWDPAGKWEVSSTKDKRRTDLRERT